MKNVRVGVGVTVGLILVLVVGVFAVGFLPPSEDPEPAPPAPSPITSVSAGDTFQTNLSRNGETTVQLAGLKTPTGGSQETAMSEFYPDDVVITNRNATRQGIQSLSNVSQNISRQILTDPYQDYTIVRTETVTAEGTPLVSVYYEANGRNISHSEHMAGMGLGVLRNSDAPNADAISAAQAEARANNSGVWVLVEQ